jgi:hypothetical protein
MHAKEGPKAPPSEKVQSLYKNLSVAAKSLNAASDELGKAISVFDAALQKLNLGISAWAEVSGGEEFPKWWGRYLGYARVGGNWGIAVKKASGNYEFPEEDSEEIWLFNDAPRWMRVEAVARIPELLEALLRQAEETTKKIGERTTQAYELAAAMSKAADEAQPAKEKADARPA